MLNVNKNLAIAAARHESVLLLDPDERVTPGLAAQLGALAGRESEHSAYWGGRRELRGSGNDSAAPSCASSATGEVAFPVSTSTRW